MINVDGYTSTSTTLGSATIHNPSDSDDLNNTNMEPRSAGSSGSSASQKPMSIKDRIRAMNLVANATSNSVNTSVTMDTDDPNMNMNNNGGSKDHSATEAITQWRRRRGEDTATTSGGNGGRRQDSKSPPTYTTENHTSNHNMLSSQGHNNNMMDLAQMESTSSDYSDDAENAFASWTISDLTKGNGGGGSNSTNVGSGGGGGGTNNSNSNSNTNSNTNGILSTLSPQRATGRLSSNKGMVGIGIGSGTSSRIDENEKQQQQQQQQKYQQQHFISSTTTPVYTPPTQADFVMPKLKPVRRAPVTLALVNDLTTTSAAAAATTATISSTVANTKPSRLTFTSSSSTSISTSAQTTTTKEMMDQEKNTATATTTRNSSGMNEEKVNSRSSPHTSTSNSITNGSTTSTVGTVKKVWRPISPVPVTNTNMNANMTSNSHSHSNSEEVSSSSATSGSNLTKPLPPVMKRVWRPPNTNTASSANPSANASAKTSTSQVDHGSSLSGVNNGTGSGSVNSNQRPHSVAPLSVSGDNKKIDYGPSKKKTSIGLSMSSGNHDTGRSEERDENGDSNGNSNSNSGGAATITTSTSRTTTAPKISKLSDRIKAFTTAANGGVESTSMSTVVTSASTPMAQPSWKPKKSPTRLAIGIPQPPSSSSASSSASSSSSSTSSTNLNAMRNLKKVSVGNASVDNNGRVNGSGSGSGYGGVASTTGKISGNSSNMFISKNSATLNEKTKTASPLYGAKNYHPNKPYATSIKSSSPGGSHAIGFGGNYSHNNDKYGQANSMVDEQQQQQQQQHLTVKTNFHDDDSSSLSVSTPLASASTTGTPARLGAQPPTPNSYNSESAYTSAASSGDVAVAGSVGSYGYGGGGGHGGINHAHPYNVNHATYSQYASVGTPNSSVVDENGGGGTGAVSPQRQNPTHPRVHPQQSPGSAHSAYANAIRKVKPVVKNTLQSKLEHDKQRARRAKLSRRSQMKVPGALVAAQKKALEQDIGDENEISEQPQWGEKRGGQEKEDMGTAHHSCGNRYHIGENVEQQILQTQSQSQPQPSQPQPQSQPQSRSVLNDSDVNTSSSSSAFLDDDPTLRDASTDAVASIPERNSLRKERSETIKAPEQITVDSKSRSKYGTDQSSIRHMRDSNTRNEAEHQRIKNQPTFSTKARVMASVQNSNRYSIITKRSKEHIVVSSNNQNDGEKQIDKIEEVKEKKEVKVIQNDSDSYEEPAEIIIKSSSSMENQPSPTGIKAIDASLKKSQMKANVVKQLIKRRRRRKEYQAGLKSDQGRSSTPTDEKQLKMLEYKKKIISTYPTSAPSKTKSKGRMLDFETLQKDKSPRLPPEIIRSTQGGPKNTSDQAPLQEDISDAAHSNPDNSKNASSSAHLVVTSDLIEKYCNDDDEPEPVVDSFIDMDLSPIRINDVSKHDYNASTSYQHSPVAFARDRLKSETTPKRANRNISLRSSSSMDVSFSPAGTTIAVASIDSQDDSSSIASRAYSAPVANPCGHRAVSSSTPYAASEVGGSKTRFIISKTMLSKDGRDSKHYVRSLSNCDTLSDISSGFRSTTSSISATSSSLASRANKVLADRRGRMKRPKSEPGGAFLEDKVHATYLARMIMNGGKETGNSPPIEIERKTHGNEVINCDSLGIDSTLSNEYTTQQLVNDDCRTDGGGMKYTRSQGQSTGLSADLAELDNLMKGARSAPKAKSDFAGGRIISSVSSYYTKRNGLASHRTQVTGSDVMRGNVSESPLDQSQSFDRKTDSTPIITIDDDLPGDDHFDTKNEAKSQFPSNDYIQSRMGSTASNHYSNHNYNHSQGQKSGAISQKSNSNQGALETNHAGNERTTRVASIQLGTEKRSALHYSKFDRTCAFDRRADHTPASVNDSDRGSHVIDNDDDQLSDDDTKDDTLDYSNQVDSMDLENGCLDTLMTMERISQVSRGLQMACGNLSNIKGTDTNLADVSGYSAVRISQDNDTSGPFDEGENTEGGTAIEVEYIPTEEVANVSAEVMEEQDNKNKNDRILMHVTSEQLKLSNITGKKYDPLFTVSPDASLNISELFDFSMNKSQDIDRAPNYISASSCETSGNTESSSFAQIH